MHHYLFNLKCFDMSLIVLHMFWLFLIVGLLSVFSVLVIDVAGKLSPYPVDCRSQPALSCLCGSSFSFSGSYFGIVCSHRDTAHRSSSCSQSGEISVSVSVLVPLNYNNSCCTFTWYLLSKNNNLHNVVHKISVSDILYKLSSPWQ